MPFCKPRWSRGNTSGRSRLKIRNISAVQRPMPRTSTSSAMISSSDIRCQQCTWMRPSAKCWARSAMYSVLRSDRPQARSFFRSCATTASGVTVWSRQMQIRSHTLCAALTEICWPQIARASVRKGSPRRMRWTPGRERMIRFITASFLASARLARSQYSGFMHRQVGEQVLWLHFHHAVLARKREIDRPALQVGAHRRRIVELQREDREDVAHAALLDLAAGPQLVQDRGRLGVEADVPGPARLLDLFHGLHVDAGVQEMEHPGLDHAAERVERRPSVGQADHRVVARLALPVERGVAAVENIQIHVTDASLGFDDQLADRAVAVAARVRLDRLEVGEQHVAFLDGRLLVAPEELGGAQPERVVAAIEDVAQDHVHELVDEKRRHLDRRLEEAHVAALDRPRVEQLLPKTENHAVVVAGVGVFDRFELLVAYGPAGLFHERGVKRELGLARLLDRMDLRPQVIGAQKIVRDPQSSGRVAL